ncbi:MAG: GNAT family N-acetyltransferase [Promethearchaeota archaeon]
MKIIPLDSETEPIFWRYVEDRIEEYFFYIMDYKQYPDFTKIWMAIDDSGKIQGLLLNYKDKIIHLRGSNEVIKILVNQFDMSSMEITVMNSQKELLSSNYKENKKEILINRMVIHSGENLIKNEFTPEILEESDRKEIASLYRKADPVFWGHVEAKDIEFSEKYIWFGIKHENRIVSFAQIWFGDEVGIIPTVATDPEFRNRGYATTLVSRSVQELFKFKNIPLCLIHVRADNAPAVHTYKKIGFKDYFQFAEFKLSKKI